MNNVIDMVNHPGHYQTKSGLEVIDIIAALTEDLSGIEAVDTANAIKYLARWKKKNGVEDLKKARWYLNHLIDREEAMSKSLQNFSNAAYGIGGGDTHE